MAIIGFRGEGVRRSSLGRRSCSEPGDDPLCSSGDEPCQGVSCRDGDAGIADPSREYMNQQGMGDQGMYLNDFGLTGGLNW